MDNKFKRIIEFKKQKGSNRKPKYATRKLSIGLVSCMLGYALLVSPSSVEAAGLDIENQTVAEESAEPETESEENLEENKEETPAEGNVEEKTPAPAEEKPAETTENTEAPKETEETSEKEEAVVEEKEAFTLTEEQKQALKEADFTDSEIEKIEEEIAGELKADSNFDTDSFLKDIIDQKASELEKSEEAKPEPVAAGEKKITNIQGTIDGNIRSGITKVKPLAQDAGEDYDTILKTAFSFDVPDAITGGDTFEVKVSDNVNLHGISKDSEIDDLYYNGELLAKAEVQADGRTIIYRFTDYVDKIAHIKMNISFPLFIDKVNVPENSTEEVVVTIDGNQISKTFEVDYSRDGYYKSEEEDVETLSGKANLDTVTDTTYHHTIYVNTNNQELTNSQLRIRNQDNTDGAVFDQDVLDSFRVYRLNDGKQLKGSFNLDYADLTDVTDQATIRKPLDEKMGILVDINQKNDKASYVVVYDGKRKENTSLNTIVEFGAASKKRMDGTPEGTVPIADRNWSWKNDFHFDDGDAGATGDEKPEVYKLGDTVWYDENGNGIQDEGEKPAANVYVTINIDGQKISLRTDENGKYTFNNLPNGEYELTFSNFDGYKVTTPNVGDNDELDSDGVLTDGVVSAKGTIKDADNMSVDLGLIAIPGTFQEHHKYITKDEDGNVIDDETITEDGEVKEGTKDQTYPTGKKDKEGYTFVRTENAVNEPTYNENGEAAEGNFKPGEKQEITYVYERTITTKGTFQEHHVYLTKDEDGNVIDAETITEDGEVKEGTKDETYPTGKKDKEGYTFVRTENAVNEPTYNENGEAAEGNFKPGEKQEITYVYERTIITKGSFQEHHIYITKDKDGKEIKREVVDGKVSGGTKDMTYTTGKDEKDGFKFVRTEDAKENPSYDKDGKETKGNFKPGVTQEITYVYEKTESEWTPIEETGKFQEHHIYITKDKDGKEIKREVVDGKVSGGTKDMTYTTGKDEKDGFKFVRTEDAKENPSYDKDGKETTGNFKPGVTQEITYVYEKTETPWTPLEPSKPIEKDPKDPTPEPGKPEGNTSNGVKVPKATGEKTSTKVERKSNNPKMGVESASGVIASLVAATGAMFASRKKKEDEDK